MITKLKLNKTQKFTKAHSESENGARFVTMGYDLINQTKVFLNDYYAGCFEFDTPEIISKEIFINISSFALLLKKIVKAVFGKEIVKISASAEKDFINFTLSFNTEVINGELKEELLSLAKNSGYIIEISDSKINIKIDFVDSGFTTFGAISSTFIYNILKKEFGFE